MPQQQQQPLSYQQQLPYAQSHSYYSPVQQQQQQQQQRQYQNQYQHNQYSPQGRRNQGLYPDNHQQQNYNQNRLEEDERTYDYGAKDDESQGSTTFQQQLLEAERRARQEQSHTDEGNTDGTASRPDSPVGDGCTMSPKAERNSPGLKSQDPLESYRQTMENPVNRTAAGVFGAATLGCIVMGPVGMLLGAAAVGIGVGVMQIPEEQRNNMAEKATKAASKVHDQAISASETLSNSCATTYKDSGIAEHIPPEMSKFCVVSEDDLDMTTNIIEPSVRSEDSDAMGADPSAGRCGGGVGDHHMPKLKNQGEVRKPISPTQQRSTTRTRSNRVACLRHGKFVIIRVVYWLEYRLSTVSLLRTSTVFHMLSVLCGF